MLQLPVEFDFSVFCDDCLSLVALVIPVIAMIAGYNVIRKGMKKAL